MLENLQSQCGEKNGRDQRREQAVCPVCDFPNARIYVEGERDRHRPIQRPFRYYRCPKCRLRFQNVEKEEAAGLFGDVEQKSYRQVVVSRQSLRCDEDVLRVFAALGPGRRLLDIGAGEGWFLRAAKQMGFDATGIDVSESLAKVARRISEVPVLVGQLTELDLPEGSFDWINMDQVLMYIPHVRETMRRIAQLLRPGGICRIREYDADSLSCRLKGRGYWMYTSTNTNVLSGKSIALLARDAGLEVARIIPGTETSLARWLATVPQSSLRQRIRDTMLFGLRRLRLFGVSVAADNVFYLRKKPTNS